MTSYHVCMNYKLLWEKANIFFASTELQVHKMLTSDTRNNKRSFEKFCIGRGSSETAVRYGETATKLVKADHSCYSFFAAFHIRACAYKSIICKKVHIIT